MKKYIAMFLAAVLAFGAMYAAFAVASQHLLAHSVVRLRVVGAGDGKRDQEVKLMVRDHMLALLGEDNFASREEAVSFLINSAAELETEVNSLLAEEGSGYAAKITVENVLYPECEYESFTLPAGRYVACTVTLGEGKGKNWWCVLFPPLCYGMEPTEEIMETGSILLTGQEEPEIEFRFRILEWIGAIKERLER
ncbi:MAG: stage II sporulation protein R [Clostridia bacterium]|nr:stage II sporulation protein R [Clostridia bacterium]